MIIIYAVGAYYTLLHSSPLKICYAYAGEGDADGGVGGDGRDLRAIGDGVNADNIKKCLAMLRDNGYTGVLSMECEGQAGPMIEKSLAWLRKTMEELKIPVEV